MPTTHTLLPMTARTASENGLVVPLAGRTRLSFSLSVARVSGALGVAIDASADANDWDNLYTFAPTVNGVTTKSTTAAPPDFIVRSWHRYIRARVVTITSALVELVLSAPFIDTTQTGDAALFSKELRGFDDGFARLVTEAEDDVLGELMRSTSEANRSLSAPDTPPLWSGSAFGTADRYGRSVYDTNPDVTELRADIPAELVMDARFDLPGFGDVLRSAIVAQAEHLYRRHKLQLANDAASAKTLRELPDVAGEVTKQLNKYRNKAASTFRGR